MRMLKYLSLFMMLNCSVALAQTRASIDTLFSLPDSVSAFTIENFYALILENHPIAKQARLLPEVARQEIRLARGNFDPKLEAEFLTKHYENKEYYNALKTSVKIPTRLPIDPSFGVERNKGDYLNPERYIANEYNYQQYYAGISIPLGRGLNTDERRTALRQADLFKEMTEADQVKLINKLLLDAAKDYWQWYYAYYNYRLLNQSVKIAEEIFRRVNVNYQFGESAVIDTVQAKITWQQRQIEQQEALLDFQNSGLRLSTSLWDSLSNPLTLSMQWAPVLKEEPWMMTQEGLQELTNLAKINHPELLKLDVKIRQIEVDKKLAAEYLKPQLNLNYYMLNQPFSPNGFTSFTLNDNYKVGVDFSFPIFLRKERSKLALTNLKLSNTKLEQTLAQRQIVNDILSIYNQLATLQSIMSSQREMMMNYERLLQAELVNLEQGESDLFKINVQQEKFIQSQTKWLKLVAEFEKQKAVLYWAAGIRNLKMS